MGDLALFDALIDALDLPPGWRSRLKRHFWRPDYFRELLARLAAGDELNDQQALITAIAGLDEGRAKDVIEDVLKLAGIAPVDGRTVEEVAERLLEQAELASSSVPRAATQLISDFLAVTGTPQDSIARIGALTKSAGVSIEPAIARFERRMELTANAGLDLSKAQFATGFGRNMAYYTGFVFEFRVAALGPDGYRKTPPPFSRAPVSRSGRMADAAIPGVSTASRMWKSHFSPPRKLPASLNRGSFTLA